MQGKLREAQEVPMRLLNQVPALAGTAVTLAARVVEALRSPPPPAAAAANAKWESGEMVAINIRL